MQIIVKKDEFREALLSWYHREKRDLPWRRTSNPYYIWVSEVMLQQTRVDTVIPYYERFIESFPTMEALAEAEENDLLKMWEGLGYYSRARNLQAGVREVVCRLWRRSTFQSKRDFHVKRRRSVYCWSSSQYCVRCS